MTPQEREVMQMALDALEKSRVFVTTREKIKHPEGTEWYDQRIEALRAALAQPEQEPVAWMEIESYLDDDNLWNTRKVLRDYDNGIGVPLYTAPPQREWQGLTEYEVGFLTVFDGLHDVEVPLLANFIRHIEAKLKAKNV